MFIKCNLIKSLIIFESQFQINIVKGLTLQEKIGEGSFGKVYKGRKHDGEVVAVKEIKKNYQLEKYQEGEINIAKQKLKHRHIVEIFEHFIDNNIYIVMEFCEKGNLSDYIVTNETKLCQRISFMCDMALGVNYLHGQNIIHRDLKAENILLTDSCGQIICKITDFGLSRIKASRQDTFMSYIGSYAYMAPEITGEKEYSSQVDIFALGLLFYAVYKNIVLTNSFGQKALIPGFYIAENRIAFLNEIMKKEKTTEDEFLIKYFKDRSEFGKFVYLMLHMESKNRPNMDSVLVHVTEVKVQHGLNGVLQRQEESIRDLQRQNEELKKELHQLHMGYERKQLEFTMQEQQKNRILIHSKDTIARLETQVAKLLVKSKHFETNLQKSKYQLRMKECDYAELEEQIKTMRNQQVDIINKMELSITNMQRHNDIQIKEIRLLHEKHRKENEVWHKKGTEKDKIPEEMAVVKEYSDNGQTLPEDEVSNQEPNKELQEEFNQLKHKTDQNENAFKEQNKESQDYRYIDKLQYMMHTEKLEEIDENELSEDVKEDVSACCNLSDKEMTIGTHQAPSGDEGKQV